MTETIKSLDWLGLQNQVCIVSGAASGIGERIAMELTQVGAHVALLDRNPDVLEVAARLCRQGAVAKGYVGDCGRQEDWQQIAQQTHQDLGCARVLVNNAGMLRPAPLAEITPQEWQAVLDVNLTGYLLGAQAFLPQLQQWQQQGGASMVHVASIAALFPQSNSGAYSPGKAGVLLLSRQLAVEWRSQRIRSNAVCPGMTRTPLTQSFYEQPGVEADRAAITCSGRVGEPQDIADAVLYLASPRASYINAQEILVDGGMSSMLMDMVPRPGFNHAG